MGIFAIAEEYLLQSRQGRVFVFLDEVNTCVHVGLIAEIVIQRSMNGRKLNPGIRIIGALNPHRTRRHQVAVAGLSLAAASSSERATTPGRKSPRQQHARPDQLSADLVYKVHPVPDSLLSFVFDFGALDDATEMLYIESMIHKQHAQVSAMSGAIAAMIQGAQRFVREQEGDDSAVSLRDVQRVMKLLGWFKSHSYEADGRQYKPSCFVLAVALVYMYRLPERNQRQHLWQSVLASLDGHRATSHSVATLTLEVVAQIIAAEEKRFSDAVTLDDGIALNEALKENIFVSFGTLHIRSFGTGRVLFFVFQ